MKSAGIAFFAIGVGSLWMRSTGKQYSFLEWAEGLQPVFGIVLAVVGVILFGVASLSKRSS
ncbi:hypothetical protein [Lentzea sp. NPDC055074]